MLNTYIIFNIEIAGSDREDGITNLRALVDLGIVVWRIEDGWVDVTQHCDSDAGPLLLAPGITVVRHHTQLRRNKQQD